MIRSRSPFLGLALLLAPATILAAAGDPYRVDALVGARVMVSPGKILPRATIVVRDGVIEAVGSEVAVPADARVIDVGGKTIYPGFIDAYVTEGRIAGKKDRGDQTGGEPEEQQRAVLPHTPRAPGDAHELPWVHPEIDAADRLAPDAEAVRGLRALGFVAAQVVPEDGIFRGQSAVVALGEATPNRSLLKTGAAQVVALEANDEEYPNSLMGVIAVIRQSFLDAKWYGEAHAAWDARPLGRERPERNRALQALGAAAAARVPVVFDAGTDPLNVLRVGRIAEEMVLRAHIVASGTEYRRLSEVEELGAPLVLPLDFPEPPKAEDDEWASVSTRTLEEWKLAPGNPAWLRQAGVTIALTTARLKDSADFTDRVRKAIAAGLDPTDTLAALTTVPAKLLGVDALLGTIEKGKLASFAVATGDPFAIDTTVQEVWVDGARYPVAAKKRRAKAGDDVGAWFARLGASPVVIDLERKDGDLAGDMVFVGPPAESRVAIDCADSDGANLHVGFDGAAVGHPGAALLSASLGRLGFAGVVDFADGTQLAVTGERLTGHDQEPGPAKKTAPPMPRGGPLASPRAVVVRDATIWTSGPQGKLEHADLLVVGGRIQAVGPTLTAPPDAHVIDGRGREVTPGIIDAHSHIAITGGVNEGSNSVTAEVRVGDVVNSEDQDIYFQLAGGVTASNLLHGSANSIGGHSQTIRLRWGAPPEKLKFEGAMPGIKFALGENVKQSNWGDAYVVRYPQTRLGVEQVMRERFLAARDYMRKWDTYRKSKLTDVNAIPPRRDLQLETIAEILRGDRLIHCHSYRQDEILMLIRLADELGITIGTFQHVLEGFRVADEIAAHGAGASSFSDWWAYKFEVYDAIPHNGALMWDRGVVVSFNSDSNDLARRLNSEAAKAIKYGGVPEEEALKFVTLNPAMQLRVDDRVGSLEPGKDADFVIWTGSPLSSTSRVDETWIEGRKYFDHALDIAARDAIATEREALIRAAKSAADDKDGDH